MAKIAVLCSRVRVEEKLLFEALRNRGVSFDRIDPRELAIPLDGKDSAIGALAGCDAVLVRCLSHTHAYYLTRWLETVGIKSISSHRVVAICGDKMLTTATCKAAGLPIPRTIIAFTEEGALQAMEEIGYPVVLKPLLGSWGRLLAKVNDLDAAEAILEHKTTLGGFAHSVFYLQEYIDKPGHDLRTLVVGDEVVYAIRRCSEHWITNTARGGEAQLCAITPDIRRLSLAAAKAVGGGVVAVDLFERQDGQLLVNEVNHTPEFHGAVQATDADVAGSIVDYVLRIAEEKP